MEPRQYEALPELPMGKQLQVDFGEKDLLNYEKNKIMESRDLKPVYCLVKSSKHFPSHNYKYEAT